MSAPNEFIIQYFAYRPLAQLDSFWDSNLASAIIGAVTALVVVIIAEKFSRQRSEMAALETLIADLTMSVNEVEFYIPIINKAHAQVSKAEIDINNHRGNFILPSFRLDASLLQSLRRSLSLHLANPDIVKGLTKCAFELEHVQNRLDYINERITLVRQTTSILHIESVIKIAVSGAVQGVSCLTKNTAELFTNTVPKLKQEIAQCQHRLESIRSFKTLPD